MYAMLLNNNNIVRLTSFLVPTASSKLPRSDGYMKKERQEWQSGLENYVAGIAMCVCMMAKR